MANNFEYCTNGVPKLMLLLEGSSFIVGLYICLNYELWMNEWWYFNSLRLIVMILHRILMYIASSNSLFSVFYFYSNSIARLSRALVFPPILAFWEKCILRKLDGPMVVGGRSRRMGSRKVIACRGQDFCVRCHNIHRMACKCGLWNSRCYSIFI